MKFGFVGATYTSQSLNADAQRTVNLYPEVIESGDGESQVALYGTPGLQLLLTLPASPIRGIWSGGDPDQGTSSLYVVAGSNLYQVTAGTPWTYSLIGSVGDDLAHSPVQMYPNGNQLFIVSAGRAYCATGGTTIVQCTFPNGSGTCDVTPLTGTPTLGIAVVGDSGTPFDPSMVGQAITINGVSNTVNAVADATHLTLQFATAVGTALPFTCTTLVTARTGTFLDGYFIVNQPVTRNVFISAINDGTTWSALDFGVKEGYPDHVAAVLADHEELWVFGSDTTEVWRDTGAAGFPFSRDSGAFIHQGTVSSWSMCSVANGVAWVGADKRGGPVAWFAQGYVPGRISTHAVEAAWAGYTVVNDCESFAYVDRGHQFWVVTFRTAGATWVYDFTAQMWHERGSGTWDPVHSTIGAWVARGHAFAFGTHVVGDASSGNLYAMAETNYSDNGAAIPRVRAATHLSNELGWTYYKRFQLDMEPGVGANTPVTLDWSNDGGHTWGTPVTCLSGAVGAFLTRVQWRRLGKSRNRVFRILITDAVKVALIDGYLDLEAGSTY